MGALIIRIGQNRHPLFFFLGGGGNVVYSYRDHTGKYE